MNEEGVIYEARKLTWKGNEEGGWGLKEASVHFLSMPDFEDENQEALILDFIDNPIITNSDSMKGIVPLHLGFSRSRSTFGQAFYLFGNPFLSCF